MKSKIGQEGENQAARLLEEQGFKVLGRNFRTRFGEIDIVAHDQLSDEIVFVEVKTRSTDKFGFPEEAVNYKKQQKIKRTALAYLSENKIYKNWRIDVVSVLMQGNQVSDIRLIKNITQY